MKILLTGASGYIGQYLMKSISKETNIEVICSDRNSFNYNDINSIDIFFKENEGITNIIHLAASVENNAEILFNLNLLGLYNLLQVASKHNIKQFVFASGNNVYNSDIGKIIDENTECKPDNKNLYGFSKYLGELMIKDFCENRNIAYSNIRIADVYGPNQKHGNLLKAIVNNIRENKPLILYGKGIRTRDYIFVEDVANGLLFIAKNNLNGIYNLSTGKGTSVKELLDIVNSIFDNKLEIKNIVVDKEDTTSVILNNEKLQKKGFVPKIDLKTGFKIIFERI